MQRLPVYLVLDVSGSMHGEPIEALKNGVQTCIGALRQDPQALETACLGVITFNNSAQQIVPLTDLASFQMPEIAASGATSLGAALKVLAEAIEKDVVKSTPQKKGDWKPIVFLITDGRPTDDLKQGIEALQKVKLGLLVACAAGSHADTAVLRQITESVVKLETTDSSAIKAFFKWISASVSAGSQKVERGGNELKGLNELPPPPAEVNPVF